MEAGLVSPSQIEIALQEQQYHNMKIGKILALHGWIKQETADFFVEKWAELLKQKPKQPLVYYFREAALLNDEQIQALIKLQQHKQKKVRFHRLAVEQGYLKQITVDFFLASLFNIYNPNNCSFTDIYEILRQYNEGILNFQKIELKKAPLMGISLKKIQLDGSSLFKANLKNSNLSNSSLIQVNLAQADLTRAVLTKVNFKRACLNQTNLREAHLEQVNFQDADLQGADLTDAYLFQASFRGADIRGTKLPSEYTYDVYYDPQTRFDPDFDPQQAGWKLKS